jgi:hypothetical protein
MWSMRTAGRSHFATRRRKDLKAGLRVWLEGRKELTDH